MPKKNTPKRVRTDKLMEVMTGTVSDVKSRMSAKDLAKEFSVKRTTMRHLLKGNLGLHSYGRTQRQGLSKAFGQGEAVVMGQDPG